MKHITTSITIFGILVAFTINNVSQNDINCFDNNLNCITWAQIGECNTNPNFMLSECKLSCKLCQNYICNNYLNSICYLIASNTTCYTSNFVKNGCKWTCNACNITSNPSCARKNERVVINGHVNHTFQNIINQYNVTTHSIDPWIVTIHDFIAKTEANEIISHVTSWRRSIAGDGVQTARTSDTSWCDERCMKNPHIRRVHYKTEKMFNIPLINAEYMQILRYKENQKYDEHHDQNSPRASAWGPRTYTALFYLCDNFTGGETYFPSLDIKITPKTGDVLVWPSVIDHDTYKRDNRTYHASLPVITGTKYAANFWVHMYSYRDKMNYCGNMDYEENWY